MNEQTLTALACVTAYLLGSIPSSVWIGKAFFGVDVREHGSGNAGATNTLRVLGKPAGFTVLFLDFLKGFVAASLVLKCFLEHWLCWDIFILFLLDLEVVKVLQPLLV